MASPSNEGFDPLLNRKDDSDFPPLPVRKRPQTLAVKPASRGMLKKVKVSSRLKQTDNKKKNSQKQTSSSSFTLLTQTELQRASPTKRKIERDFTEVPSSNAFHDVSSDGDSVSQTEKSKKMCYREPALLKSLDSDTFSFSLDQSKTFTDEEHSTPTDSPVFSTSAYKNNLGSLTDIIQQCSSANLNSLTDCDSLICNTSKSNASPLISPSSLSSSNKYSLCSEKAQPKVPPQERPLESSSKTLQKTTKASKNLPSTISHLQRGNRAQNVDVCKFPDRHICNCAIDNQPSTAGSAISDAGKNSSKDIKSKACHKNPGHEHFHLPSELKVQDLPPEIQHEDSVTFFNCLSQLVVRITVNTTSAARGPNDMYSNYIGTNSKRNGSGFIASVDEHLTKMRCKRPDCSGSDDPDIVMGQNTVFEDSGVFMSPPPLDRNLSNMSTASSSSSNSSEGSNKHSYYGGVFINTNRHVIFDKSEAESAHVHFFYNTPDKKGVVYGHVASIAAVSTNEDRVTLHVMSHDRDLFSLIKMHLKNAHSSYRQMVKSTHTSQQIHGSGQRHSWVVIISHPHGLAKSITCGRVRCETVEAKCVVKYYDAATCPGSSGGLVTTPSLLHVQWPGAVHSCSDATSGFNVTFDSRVPDLEEKLISRMHKPLLGRKASSSDNIFLL
ncbi:hypothetical protein PoB_000489300 [Plakobranchus ocellatus]|uniref:Uncharacterized protein n=1 Tax=Plakobranchus ocellatus TaxID=259542 RepID=A0AAV3Y7I8_9GAST|nr:hypothetical protein PoB_000489300 [Plakobranchus ocellatus]